MAIALEAGRLITPHVRENFFRVAPAPFLIEPRDRRLRLDLGGDGVGAIVPPPGVDGGGVAGIPCLGSSTANFSGSPVIGATTTTVLVSQRIRGPFVIHHLGVRPTQSLANAVAVTWLVSEDNDTSGGFGTSGFPILLDADGEVQQFQIEAGWTDFFPDYVFQGSEAFIKFVARNNHVAAQGLSFTSEVKIL